MKTFVLAAVLAATPLVALAQGSCSKADATRAEKSIERVSTWPQMHKTYKDFKQCDSGTVEEVYTESLIRLLVDWKNVDQLVAASQDADFKEFMYKHLRSPSAADDLESVYSRAKASCPSAHQAFCVELADVVKTANGKAAGMKPIGPKAPAGK
jgi:hypothetical protein